MEYNTADGRSRICIGTCFPLLNSGKVEPLDVPADRDAVGRTGTAHRSRWAPIDHPPGGHDDVAKAVAGALLGASKPGGYDESMNWVGDWSGLDRIPMVG